MSSDAFSVRAVIVVICTIALGSSLTLCWMAYDGREIPALLAGLVTTTIALLVPSPLSKAKNDDPVEVTTAPGDVVATTDATAGTDPAMEIGFARREKP